MPELVFTTMVTKMLTFYLQHFFCIYFSGAGILVETGVLASFPTCLPLYHLHVSFCLLVYHLCILTMHIFLKVCNLLLSLIVSVLNLPRFDQHKTFQDGSCTLFAINYHFFSFGSFIKRYSRLMLYFS